MGARQFTNAVWLDRNIQLIARREVLRREEYSTNAKQTSLAIAGLIDAPGSALLSSRVGTGAEGEKQQ
jgi:hypothetical protein